MIPSRLFTPILLLTLAGCNVTVNNAAPSPSADPAGATAPAQLQAPQQQAPAQQPQAPADGAPTEADVKLLVNGKEAILATGLNGNHKAVSLDFESIVFGAPRATTAQDEVWGVRSATVYPVQVKYKSLRTWANGESETKTIHYAYDFHKDAFGKWDAMHIGPLN